MTFVLQNLGIGQFRWPCQYIYGTKGLVHPAEGILQYGKMTVIFARSSSNSQVSSPASELGFSFREEPSCMKFWSYRVLRVPGAGPLGHYVIAQSAMTKHHRLGGLTSVIYNISNLFLTVLGAANLRSRCWLIGSWWELSFWTAENCLLTMSSNNLSSLWRHRHNSVQLSFTIVSDYLKPHGLQHTRLPCPSPTPGLSQTHVHWVSDAIQPSHPLLPSSPPAFNLSQHQGLFKELVLCSRWPKY